MYPNRVEKVAPNAFFVYQSGVTLTSIVHYDPRTTQVHLHDDINFPESPEDRYQDVDADESESKGHSPQQ